MFVLLITAAQTNGFTIENKQKEIVLLLLKADSEINTKEFIPTPDLESNLISLYQDSGIQQAIETKIDGLEESSE